MKLPNSFVQLVKFGIVGVSNTIITASIVWILLVYLNLSNYAANIVGYLAGLFNSFIWNRKWTFKSNSQFSNTAFKFLITFAISYLIQLGNLYLLLNYTTFDAYFCQLVSIVVYTLVNFILNKYYTFKINN